MAREISFGRWLKLRRSALDLTQTDLLERIDCALDAIQKIEAGSRRPSGEVAEVLAAWFAALP